MNLFEFAQEIQEPLSVKWNKCISGYQTSFQGGEVKDGVILKSDWGYGLTPAESYRNFAKLISGQVIAFMLPERREYRVPILDTGEDFEILSDMYALAERYNQLGTKRKISINIQ